LTRRTDEETIQKCIGHVNEIQNIEKEVRAIAHELSNDVFSEKSNFKTILTELLIDQQNLYSPDCVYSIDKEVQWDTFDVEIKMHIYRILQEALNNCNKYANAKTINVSIVKQEKIVTLQIRDDGDGFNVSKAKKGIGIKNMLQRSTAVNGELNIESEIGKGTTLFLKIPIK
jgi:signal transduction histidine kinase